MKYSHGGWQSCFPCSMLYRPMNEFGSFLVKKLPEGIGWQGSGYLYFFFCDWVDEFNGSGVQMNKTTGISSWIAIFQITSDWTSYKSKLCSYLMMPSCQKNYLHQIIPVTMSNNPIIQRCFPNTLSGAV